MLQLLDGKGHGLSVTSSEPFIFQALHYTSEELGSRKHDHELVASPEVILNLDCAQLGIGNSSCGPGVLREFAIDPSLRYTLHLKFMWQ